MPALFRIGFLAGNIEELPPGFYLADTVNKTAGYVDFEPTTTKWQPSASINNGFVPLQSIFYL